MIQAARVTLFVLMCALWTLAIVCAIVCAYDIAVAIMEYEQQTQASSTPTPAKVTVVVFTAEGCYGCDQAKPILESLRVQGVVVMVIDIHQRPDMASRYDVTQVPTFFVWVGNHNAVRTEDIGTVVAICKRAM
jgi:thiol-disulfide isomerase/thioredoxin